MWKDSATKIKKGDILLMIENGHFPGSWTTGCVIEVHPGTDGLTRVVTVKVKNSELKLKVNKIA